MEKLKNYLNERIYSSTLMMKKMKKAINGELRDIFIVDTDKSDTCVDDTCVDKKLDSDFEALSDVINKTNYELKDNKKLTKFDYMNMIFILDDGIEILNYHFEITITNHLKKLIQKSTADNDNFEKKKAVLKTIGKLLIEYPPLSSLLIKDIMYSQANIGPPETILAALENLIINSVGAYLFKLDKESNGK